MAKADLAELEALIRPTGFYHDKTKNHKFCAEAVANDHHGEVPRTMECWINGELD